MKKEVMILYPADHPRPYNLEPGYLYTITYGEPIGLTIRQELNTNVKGMYNRITQYIRNIWAKLFKAGKKNG